MGTMPRDSYAYHNVTLSNISAVAALSIGTHAAATRTARPQDHFVEERGGDRALRSPKYDTMRSLD